MAAHKSITSTFAPPAAYSLGGRVPGQGKARHPRAGLRKLVAVVSVGLLALLHAGAASRTSAAPAPPGTVRFVDHGGPVLHAAQVHLLYWGRAWTATGSYSPTPGQITIAVQILLAGPYLSELAQYRGIQPAVLRGSTVVTTSDPHSGFDDDKVTDFLDAQLEAGVVPNPDEQTVYIVVVPPGVAAGGDNAEFIGEHDYYQRHGQRIRFAWVADSASLDGATRIISHELVESVTDPEGSAIRGLPGTCQQGGWCEIADDICPGLGVVDGVTVASYWSERAHKCVIPDHDQPSRRRTERR